MKKTWARKAPKFIALALLAATALTGVVMLLWNNILTGVLHVGAITFLQAAGILLLSKILFGGFKGRAMGGWHMKRKMFMHWESLTPEQKEQFRSRMHSCGRFGRNNDSEAAVS